MMTTTEVNRLKAQIDKQVKEMEEMLPDPGSNTGACAVRYWFYNWLERQVEGTLRKVTKEAIKLGVIFDHKKYPEAPFTDRSVYADGTTEVRVIVNAPSSRVDLELLKFQLVSGKFIDQGKLEELIENATKPTAPAHRFTSTLVEGEREMPDKLPHEKVY